MTRMLPLAAGLLPGALLQAVVALHPQDPPAMRIEGRVVDALARAIPVAEVWFVSRGGAVARTRADGEGRFVLGAVSGSGGELFASAPTYTTAAVQMRLASGDAAWRELRLFDAVTLRGTVRGPEGRPMSGARIVAAPEGRAAIRPAEAVSDDAGRFEIVDAPVGTLRVVVAAAGCCATESVHEIVEDLELELQARRGETASVRFRIEGASAEQLAAARCSFVPFHATKRDVMVLPSDMQTGRPSVDGVWSVEGAPRHLDVGYPRVDLPGAVVRLRDRSTDEQRAVHEFVFAVGAPGQDVSATLRGTLVDADGVPMVGVELAARALAGGEATRCTTGPNGSFALSSPVADGALVALSLVDRSRVLQQAKSSSRLSLYHGSEHVVAGDTEGSFEVVAVPAVTVRGRVRSPDGRPVFGARILLSQVMGEQLPVHERFATAVSDREGRFEIAGLNGQSPRQLWIDVVGGGVHGNGIDLPRQGVLDLGVLDLERGAEIEGQVIAADERPRAGAEVVLAELQVSGLLREFVTVAWSATDGSGRYRFADLPAGRYRVSVRSGGDAASKAEDERDVEGGSVEVVDLRFDER